MRRLMSLIGTLRRFAAAWQFGRFWREADMQMVVSGNQTGGKTQRRRLDSGAAP
jgi:hypothetical protein